jgi:hypothetical protein
VAYEEQPRYVGVAGREKILWIWSYANAGGTLTGALVGIWLHSLPALCLCVALGYAVTCDYHGVFLPLRVLIVTTFRLRQCVGRTAFDGSQFDDVPEVQHALPQPARLGPDGLPRFGPARRNGHD